MSNNSTVPADHPHAKAIAELLARYEAQECELQARCACHMASSYDGVPMCSVVVALTDMGRREWEAVRDRLATVSEEVREAVGRRSTPGFALSVASIIALDERHWWFEHLRNPRQVLA